MSQHSLPPAQNATVRKILVIRLGALGDFVQSFGPFEAIRKAHPAAQITLLTTPPFVGLASASGWFDRVECDSRPRWHNIKGMLALRRQLRGYDRVYDLQTSSRTARYYRLAGKPEWSGHAVGAALRHTNPWRNAMHTLPRQRDQLYKAGIAEVPLPNVAWLENHGPKLGFAYAVLVPGAAPHRPAKRWPARFYGVLAQTLVAQGLTPLVVGTAVDTPLAAAICQICPQAHDYTGATNLLELAGLVARASVAIGNDTGPMHLAAQMGCRCIVLFSAESNPALTAPLGRKPGQVSVISVPDLALLAPQRVAAAL